MFFGIVGCPASDNSATSNNNSTFTSTAVASSDGRASTEGTPLATPEPATTYTAWYWFDWSWSTWTLKVYGKYKGMSHILHDNGGRRSGIERREFSYHEYFPERRSGKDRRCGNDRRLKPRTSK